MKVRMLVSIAGNAMPQYGIAGTFSFAPGEVVELHGELAEKWVASGNAELVAIEPSEHLESLLQKKSKRGSAAQESE